MPKIRWIALIGLLVFSPLSLRAADPAINFQFAPIEKLLADAQELGADRSGGGWATDGG